jgi:hypothetical protein
MVGASATRYAIITEEPGTAMVRVQGALDDIGLAKLELPVEELLKRARPLPPYGEMVIDDLTPEEGEAFLEAISR